MAEGNHQPYKGFDARGIASLSESDVAALEKGAGWGLALSAELNGYPGPLHVLELADALELTGDQRARITAIYEGMQTEAITKGALLIEAERALDAGFAEGALEPDALRALIDRASDARADLRFVHLSRHLMTEALLDAEQTRRYAVLRGYSDDPCASVPDGHDPTMWRRHNGCD